MQEEPPAIAEFIVAGTPVSSRSKRARPHWQIRVRNEALAAIAADQAPANKDVRVTLAYFCVESETDLDNMLKPILDAMRGIIYEDDLLVTNIVAAKKILGTKFFEQQLPLLLLNAIAERTSDFVYVKVDPAAPEVIL